LKSCCETTEIHEVLFTVTVIITLEVFSVAALIATKTQL